MSCLVMLDTVAGVSKLDFSPRVAKTLTVSMVPCFGFIFSAAAC